ncbi:small subunit ribosomal protein S8e [Halovenus aranensis]|jgi:small subunit ribosomal protein S8e|uniref:Small ribosomal subunit protein eS8 n=1 Tax=Halovenus aranensis TaxID=890420 RepID=A0A1G8W2J3_9EURY|nr:30S ribosomal protein S8e [Halovenus aranensis]SDJ72306.1 small subunit ribosomal protein S8e [Halovenus aranensis]
MKDQGRSTRRRTGGRRRPKRDKRKHELGSEPTETQVGESKLKTVDARGGTTKVRAITADTVSIATDDGVVAADVTNVVENPADPNYARRNIITRGAVIETSEGTARVTSRPGQDGQINAVLEE